MSTTRRLLSLLVALAVALVGVTLVAPTSGLSQGSQRGDQLRQSAKPKVQRRVVKRGKAIRRAAPRRKAKAVASVRKKPAQRAARQATAPAPEPVAKSADAQTVLVVGDFLAGSLAEGLNAAFADIPTIRILDRSNGSSGFAREDFYDWPTEIRALIETEKPTAVAVMLGSNDRQPLIVDGVPEAPKSARWTAAYSDRAEAFADAVEASKVPLLWVGMPSFKSSKMSLDMLALNDLYRAAAETTGGEFVDVWEGFVDENGSFLSVGPDINGQPVRLRGSDGINMTRAGKRKLAFYVEKPLAKILGDPLGSNGPGVALGSDALAPSAGLDASIDRTVPISLNDPELDGGTDLLGLETGPSPRSINPAQTPPTPAYTGSVSGRADDFAWPARAPQPPGTPPSVATTDIRR